MRLFETIRRKSIFFEVKQMGRGTKTTEFLKECLADALIKLMREKDFDKIAVKEIADTAGVFLQGRCADLQARPFVEPLGR